MPAPNRVYVMVGKTPAELLRINGANPEGKYCVHVKGEDKPRYLNEVGERIDEARYSLYNAQSAKQPTKRSKKS